MANVLYGGGVSDVRGSVGGTTMSRAKFGATHRSKTSPTQPKAPKQTQARSLLAQISRQWSRVLTPVQQAAWNAYALTNPQTNVFGQTSYLSGHQWYCKLQANIQNSGGIQNVTPPAATSQPGLLTASLATNHTGANKFVITSTNAFMPGTPYIYVFATNNLSPGIYYVNNALRFIGAQPLAAGTNNFTTEWVSYFGGNPPKLGQKQFALVCVVDQATGLISAGIMTSAIAV